MVSGYNPNKCQTNKQKHGIEFDVTQKRLTGFTSQIKTKMNIAVF